MSKLIAVDCDDSDCETEEACQDPGGPLFRRAYPDDNGAVQLTDGIYILNFLFLGGAAPICGDAADADDNGSIQLTDGIFILNFLFLGGSDPTCDDAADADDSGAIQLTDGIFILNFLFLGGAPPPAPGLDCGEDPADPNDSLGCETFNGCG